MERSKAGTVSPLRIRPLISLEVCFVCLGRGFVIGWRGRMPVRENCTQCAGNGSIVRDDVGYAS